MVTAAPKPRKVRKVRVQGEGGKFSWVPENELPAAPPTVSGQAAAGPYPVSAPAGVAPTDEPVTLSRAEYDAFKALLAAKATPTLPIAGVDEEGYAIVAPPQSAKAKAAAAEEKAWRTPDGQTYDHWYSPEFPDITLRPHHNHTIQFRGGAYTPINAKEDEYLRSWVWRQRGKNDPEAWHGDSVGFLADPAMPDAECEFCHRFTARNTAVMQAHKDKKHKREDLAEHPFTGFTPALVRAGRVVPRH